MLRLFRKATAILRTIKTKAVIHINENSTPLATRLKEQEIIYSEVELPNDRLAIRQRLDACLQAVSLPAYNEDCGMYSEHLMLFAAIAISSRYNPTNILEIGTYDGKTACILSKLFPQAIITTIDLKDDDPIFASSYERGEEKARQSFIKSRNSTLSKGDKINFVQGNSLELSRIESSQYDLIWVDGAHGYPHACCDIANSIRLLSSQGILMCDDVWTKLRVSDSIYSSIASWETLQAYDSAGITLTKLLRKRLGSKHLGEEKYVSFSILK